MGYAIAVAAGFALGAISAPLLLIGIVGCNERIEPKTKQECKEEGNMYL